LIPSTIIEQQTRVDAVSTSLSHVSGISGPAGLALVLALTNPSVPNISADWLNVQMTPGTYYHQSDSVDVHGALARELRRVFDIIRQPTDLEPELKALIYSRMSEAYL
jgi:hypothetical protein